MRAAFSAQDVIINKFLLDKKDFAEMDDEEADLLRQRDLQRLQTMERYCQTTECLRNYILPISASIPPRRAATAAAATTILTRSI